MEWAAVDLETFKYKLIKGEHYGVPFVLEIAFAHAPQAAGRKLIAGVNWSPGLGVPFDGLDAHLATPRAEYVDRGKSRLARSTPGVHELEGAIELVTRDSTPRPGPQSGNRREARSTGPPSPGHRDAPPVAPAAS